MPPCNIKAQRAKQTGDRAKGPGSSGALRFCAAIRRNLATRQMTAG